LGHTAENLVLALAVSVNLVPGYYNRTWGLHQGSWLAPRDQNLLEAEMVHSWEVAPVVEG